MTPAPPEHRGPPPVGGASRGRGSFAEFAPRPVLEDVTVVIPTLGRPILRDSLEAIARGESWPARLVLVDQGSNPEVAEWTRALSAAGLRVERVVMPRRGRAAAVNRGIERVETRFLAVTDDDCLADPEWLVRLAGRLRAAPGEIVTGRVEAAGEEAPTAVVTSRIAYTQRRPRLRHDSMSGGNMGAATDVIRRIGPLDEDPCLATAEDCEYSYRALRRGVAIAYVPEAVVRHVGWRDEEARAATYDGYARSLAGFFGKYVRRGDAFIALRAGVHLLRALRRWWKGALTGDRELALNGRAYVRGLLPGLRAGWRSGGRGREGPE